MPLTFGIGCAWECSSFFVFFFCLLSLTEKKKRSPSLHHAGVSQLLVCSVHRLESDPVSVLKTLFLEPVTLSSNWRRGAGSWPSVWGSSWREQDRQVGRAQTYSPPGPTPNARGPPLSKHRCSGPRPARAPAREMAN